MSASYPASVKVFAARSNGQTIDAAHVGDLQDEVSAIEDGILNGTAPLVSSNTRVNNLQVNGNSSVTGTVAVSSNLTVTGSVTVSSNLTVSGTFSPQRVACRLSHSAAQNVNSAAFTGLSFDTETSDDGGMHSTSVNSSRINLPVAGTYLIGANVGWSLSSGGNYRQVTIKANDATQLALLADDPPRQAAIGKFQTMTTLYKPASTTEYVTVLVAQDSGSTMSISSGSPQCVFWATLVGA